MEVSVEISEEQLAANLWEEDLLDILGILALAYTNQQTELMVDNQFVSSEAHSKIPDFLRTIASRIEVLDL